MLGLSVLPSDNPVVSAVMLPNPLDPSPPKLNLLAESLPTAF